MLVGDGEETPRSVYAFELMLTAFGETSAVAEQHVAHGGRCPQFAIHRALFDARCEVDGDSGDIAIIVMFDLASVESGSNLDSHPSKPVA